MKTKTFTGLLVFALTVLSAVAASAQTASNLPPGKYTYYGVDGTQPATANVYDWSG